MGSKATVKAMLVCEECKSRNYKVERPRRQTRSRLQLRKFCNRCRGHRLHLESK